MTLPLDKTPEVSAALAENLPVVALESTIISHGMPYPRNIETAQLVEAAVRDSGAVPATIAVLDGRLKIGLSGDDLARLADPNAQNISKLSRRDLACCVATRGCGATTVATTMIAARLAGIDVFATGGIGGVHRGAEASFDISADLYELAQTPVSVVCAGAKAILDVPKTLEVLETLGVPVVTYGQTAFPAFWSRDSGLESPLYVDKGATNLIALQIDAQRELGLQSGHLIANPIPVDHEIPRDIIEPIIAQAIAEADDNPKISGNDVTPYLLQRIFELTEGRSLETNIALVLSNARIAAEIAQELTLLARNK